MTKQRSVHAPSHEIFAVVRSENAEAKSRWHKIGAAWPHKDGEGFNLKLEYLPLNAAEMVIRKYKPKAEGQEGGDV